MSALLRVAAVFLGFVAVAGFLFGQLFFGRVALGATLAGLGGILAAVCAWRMATQATWAPRAVYLACLTALAGVAIDALHHYRHFDSPGNDYGWPIVGPFAACIAALAVLAGRRRAAARDA